MLITKKCLGTVAYLGGIPAVLENFCWSWGQMVQFTCEECKPDEFVHFDHTKASLHDVARNDLVSRMRGDWLLMLDTDHQFEPDLVWRMVDRLETAKLDVLAGFYQYKDSPHSPVLYLKSGDYYAPLGSWRAAEEGGLDVFPVDAFGAGCLMVRRSVFARIKTELGEEPFTRLHPFGEDMSFAKRLERLGIKSYCDARICCHHLQTRPIGLEHYDRKAIRVGPEQAVDAFVLKG